ncbi:WRKY19, partial [Symbiodinium sp. KB8]
MLYRFEDRFLQVEVDEEGHEDLSCADEDSRLELIAADVGLPGLVLRLNPDVERVLKRRRSTRGEPCFCVGDADAFNALFDSAE